MPSIHIGNIYFEWEMEQKGSPSCQELLFSHPLFLQLQFLPLLYAEAEDIVLVSHRPEKFEALPKMALFSEISKYEGWPLKTWGYSASTRRFAQEHLLKYDMPAWELVRRISSKIFTFENTPQLKNAALLKNLEEVLDWCGQSFFPKVLKTSFGFSGRGHLIIHSKGDLEKPAFQKFLRKYPAPLIGEPWVQRIFDFSSQWEVKQTGEIDFLGLTLLTSDQYGKHKENQTVQLAHPMLDGYADSHLELAKEILHKVRAMGYFGPAGFDAFVYQDEGMPQLHPIVELNPRRTFGYLSLQVQKRLFPEKEITLSFLAAQKNREGLLPPYLPLDKDQKLHFPKQLYAS